jgi:hypothetical protein
MSVKVSKIPLIFFKGKKNEEKKCKNLDVGQDLTEFIKILMPESLKKKLYIYIFLKKKTMVF